VFESLAFKYRWVVERLERLVGKPATVVHIIGGGAQNALLNQFTADACNRPVEAGPAEATALGNAAVQAMARGRLGSLAEARRLIRASFPPAPYEPRAPDDWNAAYARFQDLVAPTA
jgi:rhamnulokinase